MSGDLVRVRYGGPGFTDGLRGASFVGGLCQPIARELAARIVAGLGNGARVVECDAAGNPLDVHVPPSAPAPAPAPAADLAALPPEPAPDDAPEVSPAHAAPPASSPLPRHVPPPARRR